MPERIRYGVDGQRNRHLEWGTEDAQSGVAWYDLEVSVDGGAWQRVLTRTTATAYQQTNQPANSYTFRLTATDHVSNGAVVVATAFVPAVTKYRCYCLSSDWSRPEVT